ncbi:MAG: M28 family peptidase [Gemmatimonadetes bacterium]|nr:M28 family peptidase [Gemmatimonadota bacterium]
MKTTSSILFLTLILGAGAATGAGAQTATRIASPPDSAQRAKSAARILADVKYLSDDARQGRGVGTAGLDSAASYIAWQFQQAGLKPGEPDGYFQVFAVDTTAPVLAHCGIRPTRIKNVIGVLPGKGGLAGQSVIIGAHYDHLGLGGCGSLDPDSVGVVHNGADDNASGTAGVMEIARLLRNRVGEAKDARAVIFIAFTGEELGILGSSRYVANPIRPLDSAAAMLNLDMIGRMMDNRLQAMGTLTAVELNAVLDSVNAAYHLNLAAGGDGWGSSDHAAFSAAKMPVIHFFTGIHQDYHRTTDDWQKINPAGEATVASFVADVAWQLATRLTPLTFIAIAPPAPSGGGGYGSASLGTLPDMASPPGGVRIQGVRPGSAAEKAGMKGGDVLIRLGKHDIKDLNEMTKALQEHQPGDTVDVVVKRGEETLTLPAILQKRG